MDILPKDLLTLMLPFAVLFSNRVWQRAMILGVGAILAPGKRTVSAILRVMGFEQDRHFQTYDRVLNRAKWSSRKASAILLQQLVRVFAPTGVIVMGIDETIERRWGNCIAARGIYRDPVRSSHEHRVKASGLRWVSLMLLVPIPWADRVWALPFLTVLPIRWVLVRDPLAQLEAQAFLCTNLDTPPIQIVSWFCQRWQVEVPFEEVRAHLGVETQRQWSDKAIARTTLALLGLFSLVVLFAHRFSSQQAWQLQQSAWYSKSRPTFSVALALVRARLWAFRLFQTSDSHTTWIKVPTEVFDTWFEQLCYAA